MNSTAESVVNFLSMYNQLPPEKQRGLAGPVLNKVSRLTSVPSTRRILGSPNPIDLGKHLNTPGSITLFNLARHESHSAADTLGAMVIAGIAREVQARVCIPEKNRVPIRLYVDEFSNFNPDDFEMFFTQLRRFKCVPTIALQSLSQLTPKMKSLILANVGLRCVLRTGREDSAAMSKEIFDNGQAFDFTKLPVGTAILDRRGKETQVVEINAPLLESGVVSRAGAAFRAEILRRNAPVQIFRPTRILPSPPTHLRPNPVALPTPEPDKEKWSKRLKRPTVTTPDINPKAPKPEPAKPLEEDWLNP